MKINYLREQRIIEHGVLTPQPQPGEFIKIIDGELTQSAQYPESGGSGEAAGNRIELSGNCATAVPSSLRAYEPCMEAFRLAIVLLTGVVLTALAALAQGPVTVTITRISCTEGCPDAEGLGQGDPDFFAKVSINGTEVITPRAGDDQTRVEPFWAVSVPVPAGTTSVPISIQVWDFDTLLGFDDDILDASATPGDSTVHLQVNLATGRWSGDVSSSCSTGDDGPNAVKVCFDISVQSASGDADDDGLLDGWERLGYDPEGDGVSFINLPAMGADPTHKDIFLELDTEAGTQPISRVGIIAMKRAFATAPVLNPDGTGGIHLWIDTGGTADPQADESGGAPNCADGVDNDGNGLEDGADPSCTGPAVTLDSAREGAVSNCANGVDDDGDGRVDAADPDCLAGDNFGSGGVIGTVGACELDTAFYNAKRANFDPARHKLFRYAVLGSRPATCARRIGGKAEIGGNDLIVFDSFGSTLMHELGHTLGLRHGGGDNTNCKPNYVSVMNYDHRLGIPRVGGGNILDYSPPRIPITGGVRVPAPLPTLKEDALDETMVLAPLDSANRFVYATSPGMPIVANLDGHANWSGDGADPPFETGVTSNINTGALTCDNVFSNETLTGFDDWRAISISFRQSADSESGPVNQEPSDEPTIEQHLAYRDLLRTSNLRLTLHTTSPVAAGTTLALTASVVNAGLNPATSVELRLTLPPEPALPALPAGCRAQAPRVWLCRTVELAPRATFSVSLSLDVPADAVFLRGGPFDMAIDADVRDLNGVEAAPADNHAHLLAHVIASADLAVTAFNAVHPNRFIFVSESRRTVLRSTIASGGPSSPIDARLMFTVTPALAGLAATIAQPQPLQRRLVSGDTRQIEDTLTLRCLLPGVYRLSIVHSIESLHASDVDPNPVNNPRSIALEIHCMRYATATPQGDTGLWFVPTASVLDHRRISATVGRVNTDRQGGRSDISAWPATFAYGLVPKLELFASLGVRTRIGRDTAPLFSSIDPAGGALVDYPLVKKAWSTGFGDVIAGLKYQLPVKIPAGTLAVRAGVKIPTARPRRGVGTGKLDFFAGVVYSNEFNRKLEFSVYNGTYVRTAADGFNGLTSYQWGVGIGSPTRKSLRAIVELLGETFSSASLLTSTLPINSRTAADGSLIPITSAIEGPEQAFIGVLYQRRGWFAGTGFVYNLSLGTLPVGDRLGFQVRVGYHSGVSSLPGSRP